MIAGDATGPALVLDEPLSLWGGLDPETGCIIDGHHPQHGECLTDRVVIMASGRGSSSASSVLAEAVRVGTAPTAFVLHHPDEIIALGSLVGHELYGVTTPVVVVDPAVTAPVVTGEPLAITDGLRPLDPRQQSVAARIVAIQVAAYGVEAELIGFDGIPQLTETAADVQQRSDLTWVGAFAGLRLVGIIGWEQQRDLLDIDRLAVHPDVARQGWGRALVQSVPADRRAMVSTGAQNAPAIELYVTEGFVATGQTEVAPGVFTSQFERSL